MTPSKTPRKKEKKVTWWWDCLHVCLKLNIQLKQSSDADCPAPRPPAAPSGGCWRICTVIINHPAVQFPVRSSSSVSNHFGHLLVKMHDEQNSGRHLEKREFPIYQTQTTMDVQWSAPFQTKTTNWFHPHHQMNVSGFFFCFFLKGKDKNDTDREMSCRASTQASGKVGNSKLQPGAAERSALPSLQ